MSSGNRHGIQRGGQVVPSYALTQGRTRSEGAELPFETLVITTDLAVDRASALTLEWRAIVGLAAQPISVLEIGAALQVPIGVARVLVSDLASAGFLRVHLPPPTHADGGPGREILGRLLDGLRAR